MSSEDLSDLFRAIGRLEAEAVSIRAEIKDLRDQLRDSHSRRWSVWAGAIAAVISTVMSGAMLFHLGIHN